MGGRGIRTRIALCGALLALASVPAAALAEAGSDQYCDPFGGCGGGGSSGGKGRQSIPHAPAISQRQAAQIEQVLNSLSAGQRQKVLSSAHGDVTVIRDYARNLRLADAMQVLNAAGLSAVGRAIDPA